MLQAKQIAKKFGNHYALLNCSLSIEAGEVHALVGENGAGKSTLIKIITGVYGHDEGEILWENQVVHIAEPKDAKRLGIHAVYQDRHLIPFFTGYENLYLGLEYPKNPLTQAIDWKSLRNQAEDLRQELEIPLDLRKTVSEMSPPEKTMLEVLRAMMLDCRLLILDEPTASLTDQESERLFQLIERLVKTGKSILYVSHRLEEIFQISDRITVLRNGQVVRTEKTPEVNQEQIIQMMTDNQWKSSLVENKEIDQSATLALELENLVTIDHSVKNASLTVREGEIVGVFGLAGSGRTQMLEAIYGLREIEAGVVKLYGETIQRFTPNLSLERGLVLISEDRRKHGLIMNMSIRENMTLPVLKRFSKGLQLLSVKEKKAVSTWMDRLQVKATHPEQAVEELSGGNQQKVVFAKALLTEPRLFLCDEPTQAVDVRTRSEIHQLLRKQTKQQKGVLYVSSDLQEILDIADRIYIFYQGSTIAEMENKDLTLEKVLQISFGQTQGGDRTNG
ncbi:ribose transport system ATP-binding protein [Seinonella peptonophila]|uniref:Autoinducer 2 import ATP-binding protein LsrA n=1 Tax=Seinonella peptonophila TaxID=112248 RepID=A0A1M4X9H6_9BACL|nr:sugar ABC transporter ATP-binding protein [Seinonella peptonophila]SHE90051.1 ribose transport system ATP-binding protein [Seinonella peptonophila]